MTAPRGFLAAGAAAGVKKNGDTDLALVCADDVIRPCSAAAVFTSNRAAAAPVAVSREHLAETGGRATAVVMNSGNANAATGSAGLAAAERMCRATADGLGVDPAAVLVCSTGIIGLPLSVELIEAAMPGLVTSLRSDLGSSQSAARAIMTTDTRPKQTCVRASGFCVGGIGKGAAMLAPNMATMLAVLTLDAAVGASELQQALADAVAGSFNRLSIDGCTSTNDTVIALSSGAGGPADRAEVAAALREACSDLSAQMAADAEGGTKVVRVRVTGAVSDGDAVAGARSVAESPLVKCSLYGSDPYWGRVVSELGSAGIRFELDRVNVSYGGVAVCRRGTAAAHDEETVASHLSGHEVDLHADLGLGDGEGEVLTTDLGHGYIDENMGTS